MDEVARSDDLGSCKKPYEPPRLDELGRIDELTAGTAASPVDDS
jgi:hypothetical protein